MVTVFLEMVLVSAHDRHRLFAPGVGATRLDGDPSVAKPPFPGDGFPCGSPDFATVSPWNGFREADASLCWWKKLAFGFPIGLPTGCEKINRKASLSNSKLRLF